MVVIENKFDILNHFFSNDSGDLERVHKSALKVILDMRNLIAKSLLLKANTERKSAIPSMQRFLNQSERVMSDIFKRI